MDTQKRKSRFLRALEEKRGIITDACKAAGVSRTTFYAWRDSDPDFRRAAGEVEETQLDFVESKLLQNIEGGETTAIIFYLKAKGKRRGWNENYDRVTDTEGDGGESYRVRAVSPIELQQRQEEKRREEEMLDRIKIDRADYFRLAMDKKGSLLKENYCISADDIAGVERVLEEYLKQSRILLQLQRASSECKISEAQFVTTKHKLLQGDYETARAVLTAAGYDMPE